MILQSTSFTTYTFSESQDNSFFFNDFGISNWTKHYLIGVRQRYPFCVSLMTKTLPPLPLLSGDLLFNWYVLLSGGLLLIDMDAGHLRVSALVLAAYEVMSPHGNKQDPDLIISLLRDAFLEQGECGWKSVRERMTVRYMSGWVVEYSGIYEWMSGWQWLPFHFVPAWARAYVWYVRVFLCEWLCSPQQIILKNFDCYLYYK